MLEGIFFDVARYGHFVGFAMGIGAGCFADYSIVRKLRSEITVCDIGNLEIIHRIVWTGLLMLWASGLVILYARTGFVLSEFTPKLLTKLMVVTILTLNAVLLGMVAMPILRDNVDHSFLTFSLEHKIRLCVLGAVSVSSWFAGLALGIFSALKPVNFEFILPLFGCVYFLAILGSVSMAVLLHISWERKRDERTRNLLGDTTRLAKFRRLLEGTDAGMQSYPETVRVLSADRIN